MEAVNIRKFDPATIRGHNISMVIGKKLSGKTSLVKNILQKQMIQKRVIGNSPGYLSLALHLMPVLIII